MSGILSAAKSFCNSAPWLKLSTWPLQPTIVRADQNCLVDERNPSWYSNRAPPTGDKNAGSVPAHSAHRNFPPMRFLCTNYAGQNYCAGGVRSGITLFSLRSVLCAVFDISTRANDFYAGVPTIHLGGYPDRFCRGANLPGPGAPELESSGQSIGDIPVLVRHALAQIVVWAKADFISSCRLHRTDPLGVRCRVPRSSLLLARAGQSSLHVNTTRAAESELQRQRKFGLNGSNLFDDVQAHSPFSIFVQRGSDGFDGRILMLEAAFILKHDILPIGSSG